MRTHTHTYVHRDVAPLRADGLFPDQKLCTKEEEEEARYTYTHRRASRQKWAAGRQAGKQAERRAGTGRQASRHTGGQAGRQAGKQAERQVDRQTGSHLLTVGPHVTP